MAALGLRGSQACVHHAMQLRRAFSPALKDGAVHLLSKRGLAVRHANHLPEPRHMTDLKETARKLKKKFGITGNPLSADRLPLTKTDLHKEKRIAARVQQLEQQLLTTYEEMRTPPSFKKATQSKEVLQLYADRRAVLRPKDLVAAFYAVCDKKRLPPGIRFNKLQRHPQLQELKGDLIEVIPTLESKDLTRVLQGASYLYQQVGPADAPIVAAACTHLRDKVEQLAERELATCFYALGRLGWRNEGLMKSLISRAGVLAPRFYSIDLAFVASGLAGLQLVSAPLLHELCDVSRLKMGEFNARELSMLLSSLSSLDWHDEALMFAAAKRVPVVLMDMNPQSLCETAYAFSASQVWVAPALAKIAGETARKAEFFTGAQASAMLSALGELRWDQADASRAMAEQLVGKVPKLSLTELAVGVRALSRLPLSRDSQVMQELLGALDRMPLKVQRRSATQVLESLEDATRRQNLVALITLCSGINHLRLEPPDTLKSFAGAFDLPPPSAAKDREDRRLLSQLASAFQSWKRQGWIHREQGPM